MADSLQVQIELAAKDLASPQIRQVEQSMGSLSQSADRASHGMSGFQRSLESGLGFSVAYQAINLLEKGIGSVADTIIGLNASLEQNKIAFTTMLGSGDAANKMLADLQKMAAETPFELPDLEEGSKRLLAFGFAGDKVLPMLKSIGDAASGLGLSGKEGIDRIGLALGQMQAKSKVSADEMLQLTEVGVPAWDILAKAIGRTTAETQTLAEKGLIPASVGIEALTQGMEQRFPDMMQKQSQSFNGLLSTLHDNVTMKLANIGEPIFESMKGVLSGLVDLTSDPGFNAFLDSIGTGIASAIQTVSTVVQQLAQYVQPLLALFQQLQPSIRAFVDDVTGPFSAIGQVVQKALGGDFAGAITEFLAMIGTARDRIVQHLADWAGAFLDWIGPMIPPMLEKLGGIIVQTSAWIADQVPVFVTNLRKWGEAFVGWIQPRMPAILDALKGLSGQIGQWAHSALPEIMNRLTEWTGAVIDWARGVVPGAVNALKASFPQWSGFWDTLGQVVDTALQAEKEKMRLIADAFSAMVHGDFARAAQDLLQVVVVTGQALVTNLQTWARAFIDWVGPLIPPLLAELGTLLGQLGDWIVSTALPAIIAQLEQWGSAFIDWVGPQIPPLLQELGTLSVQLLGWIKDTALPAIGSALEAWAVAFIDWIGPKIPELLSAMGELLRQLGSWIKDTAVPQIADALGFWTGSFARWTVDVVQAMPDNLGRIVQAIKDWISGSAKDDIGNAAGDMGKAIMDGITNAIQNGVPGFLSGLGDLVAKAVENFLRGFGRGFGQQGVQASLTGLQITDDFGTRLAPSAGSGGAIVDIIREAAIRHGIDPNVAIRVAQSEGGTTEGARPGDFGANGVPSSFGPFQLHYGGVASGGNSVGGLGDAFTRATGLDARDPANAAAAIDFAMAQAAAGGWGPWHGAAGAGIGQWQGIGAAGGGAQMFNASMTFGGNQPTVEIPPELEAQWNKAQSTLTNKAQPEIDQFNKLLQTTKDRLSDIGAQADRSMQQASDAAAKSVAETQVNAAKQVSDLYDNQAIQRSVRDQQDQLNAMLADQLQQFQETAQATALRFQRQAEDAATARTRAQQDTDIAFQQQQSQADIQHSRARQDADSQYQYQQDLSEAAYQRDRSLEKAKTADQKKQVEQQYQDQVDSINHRRQLEIQNRARTRAEDDADRAYQEKEQADALARQRKEEDDNRAYQRQQQDLANQQQHQAQLASAAFQKMQAGELRQFQDRMEDEALKRQVDRINQERDDRIKATQDELAERQKAIVEQADRERETLLRSTQEQAQALITRVQRSTDPNAASIAAGFQQQLNEIVAAIKQAMGAVADFQGSASAALANVDAALGISDQMVEKWADTNKISWDDARAQLELGASTAGVSAEQISHAFGITDRAIEEFADQHHETWDQARLDLNAAALQAVQTLGLGGAIPTSAGASAEALKSATAATGGLTDALNDIPRNIDITITEQVRQIGAAIGNMLSGGGSLLDQANANPGASGPGGIFDAARAAAGGSGGGLHFMAAGGIATRPTLAVIGEDEPEAVVPLSRLSSNAAIDYDQLAAALARQPIIVRLDGRTVAQVIRKADRQFNATTVPDGVGGF